MKYPAYIEKEPETLWEAERQERFFKRVKRKSHLFFKHDQILRDELFAQNPYCFWCGKNLVLPEKKETFDEPKNMATLDHLLNRFHPDRKCRDKRVVLACKHCNNVRGAYSLMKRGLWRNWMIYRKNPSKNIIFGIFER